VGGDASLELMEDRILARGEMQLKAITPLE
jgi:hypothetical protein